MMERGAATGGLRRRLSLGRALGSIRPTCLPVRLNVNQNNKYRHIFRIPKFAHGDCMSPTDWRFWSALFAAVTLWSYSAAADPCDTLRDPEPRIIACTQSINSGKWTGRNQAMNYTNRGNGYREKGDLDHAIADFGEAIQIDPKHVMAFNNRGVVYSYKGDRDRAISDFNEAIRIDPKYPMAFINRRAASVDKGDIDPAIADYNAAIRLDPKYARAFNNRGNAYRAKGDADRATADHNEAIRLDSKSTIP